MTTPDLDATFRATCYRVDSSAGVFDLRIGVVNPRFDDFLRAQGARCWGLITAHNPGGVRCDDQNAARQQALLSRINSLSWSWLSACHLAEGGRWPVEPGVLILGIGQAALVALAAEFSRAAVVCGELGVAPRLVWL
jgi:hypothetical protein